MRQVMVMRVGYGNEGGVMVMREQYGNEGGMEMRGLW